LADERSVDVDDSKDRQPAREHSRHLIAVGTGRLTPSQEAWSAYVTHRLHDCDTCRPADGTPCDTARDLHRQWVKVAEAAAAEVRRS
jgi:hypothetical protein